MSIKDSLSSKGLSTGIYTLAGICKNAGKTSLLNWLISQNPQLVFGILTTGRDGEDKDTLFNITKPAVYLPKNSIFTTTSTILNSLGHRIEILEKLPYLAGTQQLWLLKARQDLETEIIGPANTYAQIKTAKLMQSWGAETIIVDGSLDRKSIALQPDVKGVFLVAGSSFGNIEQIKAELDRLLTLTKIQKYKDKISFVNDNRIFFRKRGQWHDTGFSSLIGHETEVLSFLHENQPESLYINGAITDTVYISLKSAIDNLPELLIRHPLNLQLNRLHLDQITKNNKLKTVFSFNVELIALNSWSANGNHIDCKKLRQYIKMSFPTYEVIDIRDI